MNDPIALLRQVANDGGPLQQVQHVVWNELPKDVVSYVLTFQNMELTIKAMEDDSVELSLGSAGADADHSLHADEELPWSEAIGKPIRWGWVMTNQQGYADGVQFEFGRNVSEPSTIVQLVAVSSALKLFCVQERQASVSAQAHGMGLAG